MPTNPKLEFVNQEEADEFITGAGDLNIRNTEEKKLFPLVTSLKRPCCSAIIKIICIEPFTTIISRPVHTSWFYKEKQQQGRLKWKIRCRWKLSKNSRYINGRSHRRAQQLYDTETTPDRPDLVLHLCFFIMSLPPELVPHQISFIPSTY